MNPIQDKIINLIDSRGHPSYSITDLELKLKVDELILTYKITKSEALYLLYHNQKTPYLDFISFKNGYAYPYTELELIGNLPKYISTVFKTEKSIRKIKSLINYPLLNNLYNMYFKDYTFTEFFYHLYHNKSKPSYFCKNSKCNNKTTFVSFNEGYNIYCSKECSNSCEINKLKQKETHIGKFGCYSFQTAEAKAKNKVNSQTESAKLKRIETSLLLYGTTHAMKNKSVIDKILTGKYRKYEQTLIPYLLKQNLIWDDNQTYNGWTDSMGKGLTYKAYCIKCKKNQNIGYECRCLNCYPINSNTSGLEKELLEFIQQNYKGGINTSVRNLIYSKDTSYPLELDIYLPDLNLAFEFNGTYWHSYPKKSRTYHQNKTNQALNQEIQLIHIWEHDWLNKQNIVKSMILNKLGSTPNRIYARNCTIKDINHNLSNIFLNQNHLHGGGRTPSISVGLYHNGTLVSVLTLIKNSNKYEISRFASLINHNIIGGFSKLFKYIIKKHNIDIKSIYTYADQDWTPVPTKSVYYKHFDTFKSTEPQLSYYNQNINKIEPRQKYQTHLIPNIFKDYSKGYLNKTSFLFNKNILSIYRTGNYLYECK